MYRLVNVRYLFQILNLLLVLCLCACSTGKDKSVVLTKAAVDFSSLDSEALELLRSILITENGVIDFEQTLSYAVSNIPTGLGLLRPSICPPRRFIAPNFVVVKEEGVFTKPVVEMTANYSLYVGCVNNCPGLWFLQRIEADSLTNTNTAPVQRPIIRVCTPRPYPIPQPPIPRPSPSSSPLPSPIPGPSSSPIPSPVPSPSPSPSSSPSPTPPPPPPNSCGDIRGDLYLTSPRITGTDFITPPDTSLPETVYCIKASMNSNENYVEAHAWSVLPGAEIYFGFYYIPSNIVGITSQAPANQCVGNWNKTDLIYDDLHSYDLKYGTTRLKRVHECGLSFPNVAGFAGCCAQEAGQRKRVCADYQFKDDPC